MAKLYELATVYAALRDLEDIDAEVLQDYVDIEASNQGLCPKCFTKMVPGEVVSECVGECWGRPAYQDVLVTMECPACGHEEEL